MKCLKRPPPRSNGIPWSSFFYVSQNGAKKMVTPVKCLMASPIHNIAPAAAASVPHLLTEPSPPSPLPPPPPPQLLLLVLVPLHVLLLLLLSYFTLFHSRYYGSSFFLVCFFFPAVFVLQYDGTKICTVERRDWTVKPSPNRSRGPFPPIVSSTLDTYRPVPPRKAALPSRPAEKLCL